MDLALWSCGLKISSQRILGNIEASDYGPRLVAILILCLVASRLMLIVT